MLACFALNSTMTQFSKFMMQNNPVEVIVVRVRIRG